MLTRLVEDKEVVTLKNITKVRLLFQSNLTDEETYINFSSISGLVAVARYRPDLVLETLTREFSMVQTRFENARRGDVREDQGGRGPN